MKKVLLVCGGGASSGFLAANIRKAISKRGVNVEVEALSESAIDSMLPSIDCLMLAPHLKYLLSEVEPKCKAAGVKVALLDESYYGTLNGERALDHILYILKD
ncbi:PTS sugar transporter subunit IIB [Caproiciproducens sp. CPB-2]|uniref:PTS sugar transporter subunit IIB n=1 Tax=Caproiciproducens sp. CPB-2 TaxID=3030017 RepID=UPI0023DA35A6|nr:PTS sugar transporter subunit IIB [Caproiciproducens sp. CPB-2]MDF1493170.1 PTS sugar transporter subunit IIB [Caproiciproducens sp. CPB-2]